MRLFVLTTIVMVAFAANSVLNRLALAGSTIGAVDFAAWRLVSGAVMLAVLILLRDRGAGRLRAAGPWGVAALTLYAVAFSLAYIRLDTGVGALILFGGVQVTMFCGALVAREAVPAMRWAGAALALGGLAVLLWPEGSAAPAPGSAALMAAAAFGWGIYSLIGRGAKDPLAVTAANFVWSVPIAALVYLVGASGASGIGIGYAILSGAVTSGLGYALWYAVLPRIDATVAALAQLSVPLIALAGGMAFLGEPLTLRFAIAAAMVLGGIALGVAWPARQRMMGSSGS